MYTLAFVTATVILTAALTLLQREFLHTLLCLTRGVAAGIALAADLDAQPFFAFCSSAAHRQATHTAEVLSMVEGCVALWAATRNFVATVTIIKIPLDAQFFSAFFTIAASFHADYAIGNLTIVVHCVTMRRASCLWTILSVTRRE